MAKPKGKQLKQVIDPTLAKAFTHPLRGHVWVTICEKGEASAKEIADELGLDVSEVSYHFRELKRRKLIKLQRVERRRGFAEHFYRPTTAVLYFDDFEWMEIPKPIRSTISADVVRQIISDFIEALENGTFDARDRHLSRTWLVLDEPGWEEAMKVIHDALDELLKVQKLSVRRRRKSSKAGISVSVVMSAFETTAGIARRKAASEGG